MTPQARLPVPPIDHRFRLHYGFLRGSNTATAGGACQVRLLVFDGAPARFSDDPVLLELAEKGAARHCEQPRRHALVAPSLIQGLNQPLSFVDQVFTIPFFTAFVRDRFRSTRSATCLETSR